MLPISVVVPLYNKEATVLRALQSIRAQSFTDFEAIVVDDGSSDGGAQVVRDFDDPRFHLIQQANAGPGAARNLGGRRARGEMLAFLDADDEWLPSYLTTMVNTLRNDPALGAAVSGYIEHPSGQSNESLWRRRGLRNGVIRLDDDTNLKMILFLLRFIHPCCTVIRKTVFKTLGGFYEKDRALYAEDTHLWLKLFFRERVAIALEPQARIHREDADLTGEMRGPRPVEPFLTDPAALFNNCPDHLVDLLSRVLEAPAHKTACMLGFWGQWKAARTLRLEFSQGNWRSPLALPAFAAGTPLAPLVGRLWRRVAGTPRARGY